MVKKAGVIIKPIKYQDVNPHERVEEHGSRRQKQQKIKNKGKSNKKLNGP